jgi:hypothetical protein
VEGGFELASWPRWGGSSLMMKDAVGEHCTDLHMEEVEEACDLGSFLCKPLRASFSAAVSNPDIFRLRRQ